MITDLAVLDYDDAGRLRLRSTHPGVSLDDVVSKTGFDLDVSGVTEARHPTDDELRLIRESSTPRTCAREVPG